MATKTRFKTKPPVKSPAKKKRTLYSVHPGVAMVQEWVAGLREKTGRSLEQWIAFVEKSKRSGKELRDWLKEEHGLGTNAAWWIAARAEGQETEDGDPAAYLAAAERYVVAMYAGPKAALEPIHDRLVELGLALGKDVKICPCKTIVPLYREHVFAEIKPAARNRIDFGLALAKHKGKFPKRLIDTGGIAKKDRITHRFTLTSLADIDEEVELWLKTAYDLDG